MISDIVVERRRFLPSTVPPLNAFEPKHNHWNQESNMNQGKSQPCVLILDLFPKWDTFEQKCQYLGCQESRENRVTHA